MCHFPYSVQKFSINGEYEYNLYMSVPIQARPSSASRVYKPDRMKEFSLNNEGKSCYLRLVQGRHDGLILPEVRGQNKSNLSALNQV